MNNFIERGEELDLTRVGDDDSGRVVLDLLRVALGQICLLLQLLELRLILSPLCPAQLLLSELQTFLRQHQGVHLEQL